jgi:hypothetical protein
LLLAAALGCGDDEGSTALLPDGPDPFRPTVFDSLPAPDLRVGEDAGPIGADALRVDGDMTGASTDGGTDALAAQKPFTVVVLPDTQFYARWYPQVFEAQTKWILEKKEELNIAFVLHLGDIVDLDMPGEWMSASKAMGLLDGKVPYMLAVGNHDIAYRARFGMINAFFPVSRFAGQSWFRGTFEPNDMHNSWAVIDAGGQQLLVLALEFGPRDGVVAWADGILKQHPQTPAILITHAYLYRDGTRYDRTRNPKQEHGPEDPAYGLANLPGGVNDGEEVYRKLVGRNPNLQFVLSGHDVFDAYARLTSTREDGSRVHQILSNYQFWYTCPPAGCPIPGTEKMPNPPQYMGGNGWLRVMEFAPAARKVRVRTYSPLLRAFRDDDKNQFELDL